MSTEQAKAHYSGKGGRGKLNCAQAVAAAFQDAYALPAAILKDMATCGTGKAPGGECGALFAAKRALRDTHADKIAACEAAFVARAGSGYCKEIRKLKKLPCPGCVETAAAFLETVRPSKTTSEAKRSTCGLCATEEKNRTQMPVERQVRIMAGTLVIVGSLLSWLIHPAFAVLSIMIGCGLVYAGATDTCFAAMLLSKLPWNK